MSESTLKERARDELRKYAVVAGYLYVCFAVLMLYEATLLQKDGAGLVLHGTAAVKALVLGKFILIGEAFGAGSRLQVGTLARRIVTRSLLLLLVLVVLSVVEELVVGKVHGHSLAETLAGYGQRPRRWWRNWWSARCTGTRWPRLWPATGSAREPRCLPSAC